MPKVEFFQGAFNLLKSIFLHGSVVRTFIYTLGHIIIAMTSNRLITGADWKLAGLDAIIEPLINSVWYFLLDYWITKHAKK